MLRRAGFTATLAAGIGLIGVSLHGITDVDHELKLAAATPAPLQRQTVRETVQDWRVRDCDRHDRPQHRRPQV